MVHQRAGNVHPGVLGGRRIDTHGPYLESKRRLVEQPGDEDDRREGDEETRVQARGRAKEGGKAAVGRMDGTIQAGGRVTQHLLDEIIHQFYGNVVHHDRIDDLVGAESGFEDPGMAPHRAPPSAPAASASGRCPQMGSPPTV